MAKMEPWWCGSLLVGCYLLAIVVANLAVFTWQQAALPVTAFLLIPFDLCARDVLHDWWHGRWLWPRMAGLIASGSVLSYTVNPASGWVAVASCVAFLCAGVVNAGVYWWVYHWPRWWRMNASNVCAAGVDSVVFPWLAFGAVDGVLSAAQAGSKICGGALWAAVFIWLLKRGVYGAGDVYAETGD